jgi:glycosyltransferase involved in cell wall biosynthesis
MPHDPLVTIITAAYNRANVLRYAVASVRCQTYQNWQYIIVGDCCTDDTADLICALDDPRIEFHNLACNSGGQSAPHNFALGKVRGDFIFYLNQDDFYFPDHLASCIEFLQRTRSAMIWSPVALPLPENRNNPDKQTVILDGVSGNGRYHPDIFIIASSWAMRADTAARIGPWKSAADTPVSPSQELLFRASRAGVEIVYRPNVSVLCIHAGGRPLSYRDEDAAEHRWYFDLVYEKENGVRLLMERIALSQAQRALAPSRAGMVENLKEHCITLLRKLAYAFGYHPATLVNYFRYRRDGGFLHWHRNHVLHLPVLRAGETLLAGKPRSDRFFGVGWSGGEETFRWSVGKEGKIRFSTVAGASSRKLVIRGRPVTNQAVRFQLLGQQTFKHIYVDGDRCVEIPLVGDEDTVNLTIVVSKTLAPSSLDPSSTDSRELGFMLEELEIQQVN